MLLTGELLCIPCYLFLLYHYFRDKTSRKNLQNHSIILLLVYHFFHVITTVSTQLDFYRLGYHSFFSIPLCFLRTYADFGIWYGALHIMFWISIERHIFVFYSNLHRTKRRRILFHYIPLGFVSVYAPILYFYLVILCLCERNYNSSLLYCGVRCFYGFMPE
ncbi:hypothetical protein I4U23_004253 [Adineta vaga]|nr:hypothetical protein I4U23_004253 [Adineta vaga]